MPETTTTTHWKPRLRHISLEFMGGEWAEAYIDVKYLNWPDTKAIKAKQATLEGDDQFIEGLILAIKDSFVAGRNVDAQGELAAMIADDIEVLDLEALRTIYERLMGVPDPNA